MELLYDIIKRLKESKNTWLIQEHIVACVVCHISSKMDGLLGSSIAWLVDHLSQWHKRHMPFAYRPGWSLPMGSMAVWLPMECMPTLCPANLSRLPCNACCQQDATRLLSSKVHLYATAFNVRLPPSLSFFLSSPVQYTILPRLETQLWQKQ